MNVCWKATRPTGTDWFSGRVHYADALNTVLESGVSGKGPFPGAGWLHLATVPTACAGMRWPCRLFEVEPIGPVVANALLSHKVGCTAVRVLREVDAHLALGPQGREVATLIEQMRGITAARRDAWNATKDVTWDVTKGAIWDATKDVTWDTACDAAWYAARDAARLGAWNATCDAIWGATWYRVREDTRNVVGSAARDAACALVVRDLIPTDDYRLLVGPWAGVMGWPHPDDEEGRP